MKSCQSRPLRLLLGIFSSFALISSAGAIPLLQDADLVAYIHDAKDQHLIVGSDPIANIGWNAAEGGPFYSIDGWDDGNFDLATQEPTSSLAFARGEDQIFHDRFEQQPGPPPPGTTFQDCPSCPAMITIPAGSFTQGTPSSEPQSSSRERPERTVTVPAFALGLTAVTFAEWDVCVADGGCTHVPGDNEWGRGTRPVINVDWDDAQQYVTWLSNKTGYTYRLPSESEWEYAARAGTTGRFNTGDCITTDQANFDGTDPATDCPPGIDREQTLPVASFTPNAFGLYDTHGNTWEWVQDCWNPNYLGTPPIDGSAWMTGDCSLAVARSASWRNEGSWLRSASRFRYERDRRFDNIGFRVARSVDP